MPAQLIQEMEPPPTFKTPREICDLWMEYFHRTERRWPTVRELADVSRVSRSRAGEYRKAFLRGRKIS